MDDDEEVAFAGKVTVQKRRTPNFQGSRDRTKTKERYVAGGMNEKKAEREVKVQVPRRNVSNWADEFSPSKKTQSVSFSQPQSPTVVGNSFYGSGFNSRRSSVNSSFDGMSDGVVVWEDDDFEDEMDDFEDEGFLGKFFSREMSRRSSISEFASMDEEAGGIRRKSIGGNDQQVDTETISDEEQQTENEEEEEEEEEVVDGELKMATGVRDPTIEGKKTHQALKNHQMHSRVVLSHRLPEWCVKIVDVMVLRKDMVGLSETLKDRDPEEASSMYAFFSLSRSMVNQMGRLIGVYVLCLIIDLVVSLVERPAGDDLFQWMYDRLLLSSQQTSTRTENSLWVNFAFLLFVFLVSITIATSSVAYKLRWNKHTFFKKMKSQLDGSHQHRRGTDSRRQSEWLHELQADNDSYGRKMAGFLLIGLIITVSFSLILLVNSYQSEIISQANAAAVTGEANLIVSLATAQLVPFTVASVNSILPWFIYFLTAFERWAGPAKNVAAIGRLFLVKMLNLVIILLGCGQILLNETFIPGFKLRAFGECAMEQVGTVWMSLLVLDFLGSITIKKWVNSAVRKLSKGTTPSKGISTSMISAMVRASTQYMVTLVAAVYFPPAVIVGWISGFVGFKMTMGDIERLKVVNWSEQAVHASYMNLFTICQVIAYGLNGYFLFVLRIPCGPMEGMTVSEFTRNSVPLWMYEMFRLITHPYVWLASIFVLVLFWKSHETRANLFSGYFEARKQAIRNRMAMGEGRKKV